MSDLDRYFKFTKGDLLYGFEAPIAAAKRESATVQLAIAAGYFVRANEYNNNTILKLPGAYDPTDRSRAKASETEFRRNLEAEVDRQRRSFVEDVRQNEDRADAGIPSRIGSAQYLGMHIVPEGVALNSHNKSVRKVAKQRHDPNTLNKTDLDAIESHTVQHGKTFAKKLNEHPRYNPSTVKSLGTLARKNNSYAFAMIRKACKFGLQYVTQHTVAGRIHFLIGSGNDWADVVGKTVRTVASGSGTVERVPITVSELRWAFRNHERVAGRILFYDDQLMLRPAPWVSDPASWRAYANARIRKYHGKVPASGRDGLAAPDPDTASLTQLVAYGNQLKARTGVGAE